MTYGRRRRSRPMRDVPERCGTPPDPRCSLCAAFTAVSMETARDFALLVRRARYRPGEDIALDPAFCRSLAVVVSGVAVVSQALEDGRRHIAAFRFPGEPLALGGMIPCDGTVSALTEVDIYRVGADRAETFLADHPAAGKALAGLAHGCVSGMLNHMLLLGRLSAGERLAAFLTDCVDRIGVRLPDGVGLTLPMNRTDIADHLGMNTETVSRQFSRLKKAGLAHFQSPSRLVIPDPGALRALVPVPAAGLVN